MGDTADDLYTQEQREYVEGVADCHLRDALLHQLRLRDLVSRDHELIERRCSQLENQVIELKELLAKQEE